MEQWKDIPEYEGRYQVSDLGRVRSLAHRVRRVAHGTETTRMSPARILKPGAGYSGHLSVALGKGNSKGVHTLVLRAFVGPPPEGHEALHLNHTPADNRLVNLVWGRRSTNIKMDYAVGTRVALRQIKVRDPVTDLLYPSISAAVRATGTSKYFVKRDWACA